MCGIIGVTGSDHTLDVLLEGLSRLEYRGYDSAGIALITTGSDDRLWRGRAAHGTRSLDELAKQAATAPTDGVTGVGHTRWATHGRPSVTNAHPHVDCTGRIALVHNGIIENHHELADELFKVEHDLQSETDTEVLAHLVESALLLNPAGGLAGAVRAALRRVRGAFALAVVHRDEPELIVAARRVSPLVMGLNETEAFLASDIPRCWAGPARSSPWRTIRSPSCGQGPSGSPRWMAPRSTLPG